MSGSRRTAWVGAWLVVSAAMGASRGWAESPQKLPQPTSYVSDFAGVIDAGSKAQMEELAGEVERQAHATIEVVTIQSLDGLSIEDFCTQLEDRWKVGPKGSDKGVLMVFAVKDHKRRIEVGYGLEGILNDAKVGDIGRSMVPLLQQGAYGPAILGGEQQIAAVIAADAGVTLAAPTTQPEALAPEPERSRGVSLFGVLRLFFFLAVFFFALRGGGRWGWLWFLLGSNLGGIGGGESRGGGGFGGGDGGGGGGSDFGGGFGGGSGGGGASGDW